MRDGLLLALWLAGCAGSGELAQTEAAPGEPDSEPVGEITLALTVAPATARCSQLTIKHGTSTTIKQFTIEPGRPATFSLKGLPTGTVKLSQQVFTKACASGLSGPEWVSDEVTVELKPSIPVEVNFVLREADLGGIVTVKGTFPDPPVFQSISLRHNATELVAGPDGAIWAGLVADPPSIARITPGGEVTEVPVPSNVFNLAVGSDGNIWGDSAAGLVRVSPTGGATAVPVPVVADQIADLIAGPDGNLWASVLKGAQPPNVVVVRLNTAGRVLNEFDLKMAENSLSADLAAGPDGNVWVVLPSNNKIVRISPAGSMITFSVPTPGAFVRTIVAGPDGNLWYTAGGRIGKVTPQGVITEFAIATAGAFIGALTVGVDNNLWFALSGNEAQGVGRISTSGSVKVFPYQFGPGIFNVVSGPDGFLWISGGGAKGVTRVDPRLF